MTEIFEEQKKCVLCGKISEHPEMLSMSSCDLPDLDMRPAEVARSSIDMWIQTCPLCGYCAPDISELIEKSSEVVSSDSYKQQLYNTEFPKLANAFLSYSMIQENIKDYAAAGLACIYAAWVCDDENADITAQKCRKKAIALLQKAMQNSQRFTEESGEEEAIIVDLLRRSGQFELAFKMCNDILEKDPKDTIADILRFQRILIGDSDTSCHTIAEANF